MNEQHARFIRSRPDRGHVLDLVSRIDPGARLLRVVRLKGGISTATHRLDLETRTGQRRSYVLRRFSDAPWARPDDEWRALQYVQAVPVPVPEPVLLEGRSLVMTALPGRSWLTPPDPARWADDMAVALAEVHETAFPKRGRLRAPWVDEWATYPDIERAAAAIAELDTAPVVLRHHDYWPGNTLWHRGRLSAVIDWSSPGFGPALYDVAYWRLDTALQRGPGLGDRFARTYAAHRGIDVDPALLAAWDIAASTRALPDPEPWVSAYNDLGLVEVTPAIARRRLRAFVARARRILG